MLTERRWIHAQRQSFTVRVSGRSGVAVSTACFAPLASAGIDVGLKPPVETRCTSSNNSSCCGEAHPTDVGRGEAMNVPMRLPEGPDKH
jgi:hypothetical protein